MHHTDIKVSHRLFAKLTIWCFIQVNVVQILQRNILYRLRFDKGSGEWGGEEISALCQNKHSFIKPWKKIPALLYLIMCACERVCVHLCVRVAVYLCVVACVRACACACVCATSIIFKFLLSTFIKDRIQASEKKKCLAFKRSKVD